MNPRLRRSAPSFRLGSTRSRHRTEPVGGVVVARGKPEREEASARVLLHAFAGLASLQFVEDYCRSFTILCTFTEYCRERQVYVPVSTDDAAEAVPERHRHRTVSLPASNSAGLPKNGALCTCDARLPFPLILTTLLPQYAPPGHIRKQINQLDAVLPTQESQSH